MKLLSDPDLVKGFLDPAEGARLYDLVSTAPAGPVLEVGSYCGKSTLYLGSACFVQNRILYAVDHHRGSEEHQLGEEYHDPSLYDADVQKMDSFRTFRTTIDQAGLQNTVVPIVAASELAGRHWATKLAMVFIDGGHSLEAAMTDCKTWSPHIVPGGFLAIHDIFENPADGGQAPHQIYKHSIASGLFVERQRTLTLGVLQRI
ncbi:MAG: class I SAM-dependent methyltransferase [Proteobacteria bacterium]|nr:class I SAM-dependent methyltransferase [Pseudomonadota bacterium]